MRKQIAKLNYDLANMVDKEFDTLDTNKLTMVASTIYDINGPPKTVIETDVSSANLAGKLADLRKSAARENKRLLAENITMKSRLSKLGTGIKGMVLLAVILMTLGVAAWGWVVKKNYIFTVGSVIIGTVLGILWFVYAYKIMYAGLILVGVYLLYLLWKNYKDVKANEYYRNIVKSIQDFRKGGIDIRLDEQLDKNALKGQKQFVRKIKEGLDV